MVMCHKSNHMALFFSNFLMPKKWKNGKNNINVHFLTLYCNFKPAIKTCHWSNTGLWCLLFGGNFSKNKFFCLFGGGLGVIGRMFTVVLWHVLASIFKNLVTFGHGVFIYFLSIPHIISHDPT